MCGRYTLTNEITLLAERFGFAPPPVALAPRYNIAPTQDAPVVITGAGARQLDLMRWGLVPRWAKDTTIGSRMINARAETVAEKPSFREPFKRQRCLVVADGFYEWRKNPGGRGKTPMRFVMRERGPFAMAGLWDEWKPPDTAPLRTFTIITTGANNLLRPVHDRMPVILRPEDEAAWVDTAFRDVKKLRDLLKPYKNEAMEGYEVSVKVNSGGNEGPECVEPV
jgi:putative SOS response-associated peptidase YedK